MTQTKTPLPVSSNLRDASFPVKKQYAQTELFKLHVVEHSVRIQGLLKKLHSMFNHERVADFYGYFLMGQLTLCSQQKIQDVLIRELQLLKNKQSHYHMLIRTVGARQTCLRLIQKLALNPFDSVASPSAQQFKAQIQRLRVITAVFIQQVKAWKQWLFDMSASVFADEHIAFYYQDFDYMIKILNDTDFITQSFLAYKVIFSTKQDPFLMRPATQNDFHSNPYVQLFAFTPEEQQRYIKCLEHLAAQRADYLKRRVTLRQEKIRQIQKVYHTGHLHNKILLVKAQGSPLKRLKNEPVQASLDFIQQSHVKDKTTNGSPMRSPAQQSRSMSLTFKGEKLRKLKELTMGSPIIDATKFATVQQKPAFPVQRSISLSFLKKTYNYRPVTKDIRSDRQQAFQTDFESLVRKKELLALESSSVKRRTLSSVKLQDRLSEKKFLSGREGAEQLQKIVEQLDHIAPNLEQSRLLSKNSTKYGRTLLQQNQAALVGLRKQILAQIGQQVDVQQKKKRKQEDQNEKMQKYIKQKIMNQIQQKRKGWIQGKDQLAGDMGKKALFGLDDTDPTQIKRWNQLQQDLRNEMQLKLLRDVQEQLAHRTKTDALNKQRQKEKQTRDKEYQLAIRQEQRQKRFGQIQLEQRAKALQKRYDDQERKKKQIQQQMSQIVQRQQEKLLQFSTKQKMQLEAQLRQAAKQKLLTSLRSQKSQATAQKRAIQQQKRQEQAHRQQIRLKMQQQYEISQNLQRQQQRQERNRKLKLIGQKMDHLQRQLPQAAKVVTDNSKQQNVAMMEQARRTLQSSLPDPKQTIIKEQSKKRMRQEFQNLLFAFNRPQAIKSQQEEFIVTDYKSQLDNQQNLLEKIEKFQAENLQKMVVVQKVEQNKIDNQIKPQQTVKPKQSSLEVLHEQSSQTASNMFVRFSQVSKTQKHSKSQITEAHLKAMGIDMTPDQYKIYLKKKVAINAKRINPQVISPQQEMAKLKAILGQFQRMDNISQKRVNKHQFVIENIEDSESPIDSKEQQQKQMIKQKDSIVKSGEKRIKQSKQNKKDEDLSDVMRLTVHSKIVSPNKKRFVTSDQDEDSQDRVSFKKQKVALSKKLKKKNQNISQQQRIQQKQEQKQPQPRKIAHVPQLTKFATVIQANLDDYLINHFKKLPKLVRKLNLFKKDQLLKTLLQTKHVIIIEVAKGQQVKGIVFASQNQNKPTLRSINILHSGSYLAQDSLMVLLSARDLIFTNDPCIQLTYSQYFNKMDQQQNSFIKDFEKRFDPYGSIFQKSISNSQTQRKYVLRRMIGQEPKLKPHLKNQAKTQGELKLKQLYYITRLQDDLGIRYDLQTTGQIIGGWTILAWFLANFGDEQQIAQQLASQITNDTKNIRHLAKMVQKLKDCRLRDINVTTFDTPLQANLKLSQMGQNVISCQPDLLEQKIPIFWLNSTLSATPTLPLVVGRAPFQHKDDLYSAQYIRYKITKNSKVFKLKSSLYSSIITVLPCKPAHLKILILDSSQYDALPTKISLDLYLKLFLANIAQHTQATEEHIWFPQITSNHRNKVQYCQHFGLHPESHLCTSLNYSNSEYIDSSITYEPTHRDILISPPFIMAVLSSQIEKSVQGSPIYIQRIDLNSLKEVRHTALVVQSDF